MKKLKTGDTVWISTRDGIAERVVERHGPKYFYFRSYKFKQRVDGGYAEDCVPYSRIPVRAWSSSDGPVLEVERREISREINNLTSYYHHLLTQDNARMRQALALLKREDGE